MSTVKLADTRTADSLDEAKRLMAEVRRLTCAREVVVARAEKRIQQTTAAATKETEQIDSELGNVSEQLATFILANRALFAKPRAVKTSDGSFGLRTATQVEITNKNAALDYILDCGYDDCIRISRSLVKHKIAARIQNGENIKGCELRCGDIAYYKVAKALIEEARANA